MSQIKVNDQLQEIELPKSVSDIIRESKVIQIEMVSVQLNGEFVLRENYDSTALKDGDEIDFLYFMGGGSKIKA